VSGVGAADQERFEAALVALRRSLRETLETSRTGAESVDLDEPIGRVSRIDAIQQQAMAAAGRRGIQLRLSRIEAALRRIQDGEYGNCQDCGEPIDPARLEASPEAVFCVACQKQRE